MRPIYLSLVTLTLVSLSACDTGPKTLRVAKPTLPVDQAIAENLSALLGDSGDVRLEMTAESMSEPAALEALANGGADLALISNAMPYREGIATVIPLYPTVLHIGYREGRDTSSGTALIRDASVFAGPEGSASRRMFERIVARLDISDDEFGYVEDSQTMADVVVLFFPISPDRVAEYPDIRMFSFGAPEQVGGGFLVDAGVLLNPFLRPFVIPTGTYGDATPEPILTYAVDKYLVAREDLETSMVYDLVIDLLRSRPALAARHPGLFEQLSDDFDVTRSTFVVHAGTQAYLQREAPTVYERYSGVAEVAVTVVIALFSATLAGFRILQRRRKNRIDRFYSAAIEIRDSVSADASDKEREQAVARIRDLQNEAFDQLVHEKLAANESFRIFITLSNDVLRQLGATGVDDRSSDA